MNKELKNRPKRSYTEKHNPNLLELALDNMRRKVMSSRKAELVFGIPRRTLLNKLHGLHKKRVGHPSKKYLIANDEQ